MHGMFNVAFRGATFIFWSHDNNHNEIVGTQSPETMDVRHNTIVHRMRNIQPVSCLLVCPHKFSHPFSCRNALHNPSNHDE